MTKTDALVHAQDILHQRVRQERENGAYDKASRIERTEAELRRLIVEDNELEKFSWMTPIEALEAIKGIAEGSTTANSLPHIALIAASALISNEAWLRGNTLPTPIPQA